MHDVSYYTKEIKRIDEAINDLKNTITTKEILWVEKNNSAYSWIADRDKQSGSSKKAKAAWHDRNNTANQRFAERDQIRREINALKDTIKTKQKEKDGLITLRDQTAETEREAHDKMSVIVANKGETFESIQTKAEAEADKIRTIGEAEADSIEQMGVVKAGNSKKMGYIFVGAGVLVLFFLGFIIFKKIKKKK